MSRPRWYEHQPRISFRLKSGSTYHRITWTRGRLVLHDHDIDAERVLEALGGEPCRCLRVLDGCSDPNVHLFSPLRHGWKRFSASSHQLVMPKPGDLAYAKRITAYARAAPPGWQVAKDLPEQMREVFERIITIQAERRVHRMEAETAGPLPPSWAKGHASVEERLRAAAVPAAEEAMRRSRRDLRPYATFTVECWRQRQKETPLLHGWLNSTGGTLALSLPISWLNRVWFRGLAVVQGHLVLEVDRPAPATELEGTALRWERQLAGPSTPAGAPCLITRTNGGRWSLAWL